MRSKNRNYSDRNPVIKKQYLFITKALYDDKDFLHIVTLIRCCCCQSVILSFFTNLYDI